MEFEHVTGIILAGGKSSRFGTDKALYPYNEKRMVEYAIEILRPICSEILLSTNNPGDFLFTGLKPIADIFTGCGPLGGIHACLLQSKNEHNVLIGCDLPELQTDLFRTLLNYKSGYQVVIPEHHGFKETMASYFHKSAVPILENALKRNQFKLTDAIAPLQTLFLDVEKMPFYSDKLFINLNTKEDIKPLNHSDL
jgi:molybdopterin-guanine dinucleotide biosynthesis protein A